MYGLLFLPLMVWGIVCFFRNRSDSLHYQLRRGFGWISMCVISVTILAALIEIFSDWDGVESIQHLLLSPIVSPVFLGGQTVITIFEDNVKDWTGHRRDTMFDNSHVFFGLVFIQALVLSLIVAWRLRGGKTWRDPVVMAVGAFVAINAFLGRDWPWYGT